MKRGEIGEGVSKMGRKEEGLQGEEKKEMRIERKETKGKVNTVRGYSEVEDK